MKRILLFLGSLLCAGIVMYACMKDPGHQAAPAASGPEAFTVTAARTFFESTARGLRLVDVHHDLTQDTLRTRTLLDLDANSLLPDWDNALLYELGYAHVVEVPVQSAGLVVGHSTYTVAEELEHHSVKVTMKIIVERRKDNPVTHYFLATFVPSEDYHAKFGQGAMDTLRQHPSVESRYTGLVMYSLVDGTYLRGYRYHEGQATTEIMPRYLTEKRELTDQVIRSFHFDLEDLSPTLDGGIATRSEWFFCSICMSSHLSDQLCVDEIPVYMCAQCIKWPCECCLACGGYPCICPNWPDLPPVPDERCEHCLKEGCNGECQDNKEEDNNKKTEDPPEEEEEEEDKKKKLAQEIDCDNNKVQRALYVRERYQHMLTNSLKERFIDKYVSSPYEWSSTLYISNELSYVNPYIRMTGARTDRSSNSVISRHYTGESGIYSLAIVHNHPSDNAPSAGDAISLGYKCESSGGYCTTSYVITKDGVIYALQVEDRETALYFARLHDDNAKRKELADAYMEAYYRILNEYDSVSDFYLGDISMFATAHVLKTYNAGISILRLSEKENFLEAETEEQYIDNRLKIIRKTCKDN